MMNNIEDIYSLSPSQSGLLFHSVYEPDSRVYYQQFTLGLHGDLDIVAFRNAWKALVQRHSVMRTAFLWEELDDAYQVVQTEVALPLCEQDWRGKPELEAALQQLELAERAEPLELNQAPLMRLCLVQTAHQQWHFIWTFHHIMMDGWSVGVAMQEWFELYESCRLAKSASLPQARPYKDFIAWQAEQDLATTEAFWREQLSNVSEPTPLPDFAVASARITDIKLPYAEQQTLFSQEETKVLQDFVRTERLTLNTLFQGAWALLLGHHSSRAEVMFGVTVAGRPDSLAASDSMVGLFINTLPLQVEWTANPTLNDWLRNLQERNSEMRQHAWLPLAKLKPFSQVPADRPLFDSILVFEN
ncbi:MAG: condensation domain-containing protein, partial [Cellvibrio sp.]